MRIAPPNGDPLARPPAELPPAARQVRTALGLVAIALLLLVIDVSANGTDFLPDWLGAILLAVGVVWLAQAAPSDGARMFWLAAIPAVLQVVFVAVADGGPPAGGDLPAGIAILLLALGMREVGRDWDLPLTLRSWTTSLGLVALLSVALLIGWAVGALVDAEPIELDGVGVAAVGVALIVGAFLTIVVHPLVSIVRTRREIALGPLEVGRSSGRLIGLVALMLVIGTVLLIANPNSRINKAFDFSYPFYDVTPLFEVAVNDEIFHVRLATHPDEPRHALLVHMGWNSGGGRAIRVGECMYAVDTNTEAAPDGRTLVYGAAIPEAAEVRWTAPDGIVERVRTHPMPNHPLRYFYALVDSAEGVNAAAYDASGRLLGRQYYGAGRGEPAAREGIHDQRSAETCRPEPAPGE